MMASVEATPVVYDLESAYREHYRSCRRPSYRSGNEAAPYETPTGFPPTFRALRALPDRQREVLALRYYLDLSEAEIARTLGISKGSVKTHAHRGLATLAPRLEDLR